MDNALKKTRAQFVLIISLVIIAVVGLSWVVLQTYNVNNIGTPAQISEIKQPAEDNQAYAEYLDQQQKYEAHFLTLASSIKQQEQDRLTGALAITFLIAIVFGIITAMFATKTLTKPVLESYKSQERFIQDAAHELRNPLAAMTIAIQQTKESSPLLTVFKRQTKRLVNINEDLLFLERRSDQTPSFINLSELTEDIIEELQPIARLKNILIIQKVEEDIMKKMSSNDYVKLVKNIIDNAIKYSNKNSKVKVSLSKEKNSTEIIVQDYGIGIPAGEQSKIGSRFYRANNTGNIDGTGLGLAIVQKILNIYGGKLQIESKLGKGTKVSIKLPT
jgi:signal transduction histidine kinase